MGVLRSAWLFLCGVLKRAIWYVPPLLLDPFDVAERVFKVDWIAPQWLALSLFLSGWAIAIVLTYHELRIQNVSLEKEIGKKSGMPVLRGIVYRRPNYKQSAVLIDIAETMRKIHGHSDDSALEQDYLDGVLPSDLLGRSCTVCGNGTLRNMPEVNRYG